MTREAVRIVPLRGSRIGDCRDITAASEPWKTLGEGIDFNAAVQRGEAYVCVSGNSTAGFVIFNPSPVFGRGGYLRAIGVSPAMRRSGIGSLLLDFAEHRTARSSEHLYLCVSSFNRAAQRFYRSRGYRKIGSIPGLVTPHAAEYIFWKRLRRSAKQPREKG